MKKIALAMLFSICAHAELPADILASHDLYIGFAPPTVRGHYAVQLHRDGTVTQTDNREVVTVIGHLNTVETEKVTKVIDKVEPMDLPEFPEQGCFDVPSSGITIQKTDGTEIEIQASARCNEVRILGTLQLEHLVQSLKGVAANLSDMKLVGEIGSAESVIATAATYAILGSAGPKKHFTHLHADGSVIASDLGIVTHLLTLNPESTEKVVGTIDAIEKTQLSGPTSPPCMNLRSTDIDVKKSNGQKITIFRDSGCNNMSVNDSHAIPVELLMKDLESLKLALLRL